MRSFIKVLNVIADWMSKLATLILTAMMVLIVLDVLLRGFFNRPITGATEVVQMMMVGMVFGFAKSCLGTDNLKVDFVANKLPKKLQFVFDISTSVLCIGVCLLLGWQTFQNAMYTKAHKIVYLTLTMVPKWFFVFLLSLAFLGGIVGFILHIDRLVQENRNRAEDAVQTEEGGNTNVS